MTRLTAIVRYWIDFAAWVKVRNRRLQVPALQPIPVESWAELKLAYAHAQRVHHGQRVAYTHLRKGTHEALMRAVLDKEDGALLSLIDTHPWLFARGEAFDVAIKAIARNRVARSR
jgi:hypothetical protein